ncbi:MAG: RsmD family RNA methyltransferase, partial [Desulfocapsaceae bacterium]
MGNFSVPLARQAKAVLGIEGQGSAIRSAKRNSEHNNLTNCTFIKSEVTSACRDLATRGETFAIVVCDPPRRGLTGLVDLAGSLARKRIVYISCDPATLCRDLQEFVGRGFLIGAIQPVDMFPQTHHLETVVVLEKKSSG